MLPVDRHVTEDRRFFGPVSCIPGGRRAGTRVGGVLPQLTNEGRAQQCTRSARAGPLFRDLAEGVAAGRTGACVLWRNRTTSVGRGIVTYHHVCHLSCKNDLMNFIETQDPEIWAAIAREERRQQDGLEMIASENYTSPAVMQAAGSVLTNKYAEGYPGRRYYGGCENVDVVEDLARQRAKDLFAAEFANVQPHSGSQANMAVYLTVLEPGDTVLGLDLAHGGHLTHGMRLNISGRLYHFINYGVTRDTHRIDFDQVARLAREHKPKLIVAGASAYPREIPHDRFAEIAREVGAKLFVDMAHYAGLVAAGLHHNPVPVSDFVTTTTHKTLRGPRSGLILCKSEYGKDVNRSVFPGSQGGPLMHIIAGKAICFREAMSEEFKTYARAIIRQCQDAGRSTAVWRAATDQWRHRQSSDAGGCHAVECDRQDGGNRPGTLRDHGQHEHDSVRSAEAARSVRYPYRNARTDHARHGIG